MVSIWMLCASRTPGSERHKALQAGPRPRAPLGARQPGRSGKPTAPGAGGRPSREPAAGDTVL